MKIEVITNHFAPALTFAEQVKAYTPLSTVEVPTGTADVLIVCVGNQQAIDFLERVQIPASTYVVFWIFTLTGAVVPYLKTADQIIWFGPMQERIVKDLLGFSYPGKSLPFPVEPITPDPTRHNVFTAVGKPFDPANSAWYTDVIACASSWFPCVSPAMVHILFEVDPLDSNPFEQFRRTFLATNNDQRIRLVGTHECTQTDVRHMIASAAWGEYFRQEISSEQILELLEQKKSALLYIPFESDATIELMKSAKLQCANSFGGVLRSRLSDSEEVLTIEQFAADMVRDIAVNRADSLQKQEARIASTEIDTWETLDIVHGTPLNNRYIFSICFRNQESKIVRALESIVAQKGNFDIGIAIVDDGSADRSSELILQYLADKNIPFVLVKNRLRRFASRNFYNIINVLTTGSDSVIIELDGDDFLNGDEVLVRLDREYSRGILKTSGSFIAYPDNENNVAKSLLNRLENCDFSRPWALSACNAWLPLRSCHRSIASKVEIEYFLDRTSNNWLSERHDSITNSRMIELAGPDRCSFVNEPLYVYDLSGMDHDHGSSDEFDHDAANLKLYKDIERYYRAYSV